MIIHDCSPPIAAPHSDSSRLWQSSDVTWTPPCLPRIPPYTPGPGMRRRTSASRRAVGTWRSQRSGPSSGSPPPGPVVAEEERPTGSWVRVTYNQMGAYSVLKTKDLKPGRSRICSFRTQPKQEAKPTSDTRNKPFQASGSSSSMATQNQVVRLA